MNRERIRTLTQLYRNHYEEWMQSRWKPLERWAAVVVCAREFDPEAEDFPAMTERAFRRVSELESSESARAVKGLFFLNENGKAEELRLAFRELLSEDGGSLEHRAQKAERFENTCNQLLEGAAPGCWELLQKRGSGLNLLAMIRPEENFLFRAPEVTAFAGYTEVEEEIGYDRFLKLPAYHKNMEELAEILAGEAELVKLLKKKLTSYEKESGLTGLWDADPAGHLLAFDLVQAVYSMNLYAEKAARRKSRISTASQRRIEHMQKAAELLEEREEAEDDVRSACAAASMVSLPVLEGERVQHKSFGEGTITQQDGHYLVVDFDKGLKKKFVLPGAITGGFLLVTGKEELAGSCLAAAKATEQVETARKKREALDVQIRMLMSL